MKRLLVTLITLMMSGAASAQKGASRVDAIRTVPEKTDFKQTSHYADVVAFMEAIDQASDRVHLTTFGTTNEKRSLPLAVIGADGVSPDAVKRTGKLRIYASSRRASLTPSIDYAGAPRVLLDRAAIG